jgi:hypothetical protein
LLELQSKFGQKKEGNFQVLVPVKALLSIKTMKHVAIVENSPQNKIVGQILNTINPVPSIFL